MGNEREQMRVYGRMADFEDSDSLLEATKEAYAAGYRKIDAYSPMPIHGLAEELGFSRPLLPLLVLIGGIFGACAGYGLQYYTSVIDYPINVGGRPLHSWPAIGIYLVSLFSTRLRIIAIGLLIHMVLDGTDCFWTD